MNHDFVTQKIRVFNEYVFLQYDRGFKIYFSKLLNKKNNTTAKNNIIAKIKK